ncbi:nephrocystin-3-like [Ptychodera flava]|uniref:nephrocystin-3-like n=1 Tax=Ptychodera flava TaxID=63121 RepID=UPI00396A3BBE
MYLKDGDGVKNWWHHKLADYFQTSADTNRRAEELPYHLVNIDDIRRLEECLLEWPVFLTLYKAGKTVELMGYWRIIGGYELAATLYVEKLEMSNDTLNVRPEGSKTTEAENMYKRKLVSGFLAEIGQYDRARENLCKFVEFHVKEYGNDDIESLMTLLRLCYDEVKKFSYEAHPDCRKCQQFGKEYAERCLQAYKRKGIDEDDPSLGQFYLYCSYFLHGGGYLDKAERIFKRNGDNKGMAQLLSMRGQTMQYHEFIEAVKGVYEKALKLCHSEFGEFHKVTARCYQSYGQLYWNRWAEEMDQGWETYLTDSVKLYKKELQILETLLGPLHPNVVRSRQDVIIVLETMGNQEEADELKRQQPQGSERIAEYAVED